MLASHFHIRQQIHGLLLELPELTQALESRLPDASARLVDLLDRAERLLLQSKLRQAADLAASRAAIAAARLDASGRTRTRHAERLAALQQIGAIRSALTDAVARSEAAIDSARPIIRQLLQLVAASGALTLESTGCASDLVERIVALASEHQQLQPLMLQVRIALGRRDILLVMADEIDLADFAPAPGKRISE